MLLRYCRIGFPVLPVEDRRFDALSGRQWLADGRNAVVPGLPQGYDLEPGPAVSKFAVVVEKYTAHPENAFESPAIHRSADGYNCFLITDQFSVTEAVNDGATRSTDADLENQLSGGPDQPA